MQRRKKGWRRECPSASVCRVRIADFGRGGWSGKEGKALIILIIVITFQIIIEIERERWDHSF